MIAQTDSDVFVNTTIRELIANLEIFDRDSVVYICNTGNDLDLESIVTGWEHATFKIIKENIIEVISKNFNVKIQLYP